MFLVRDSECTGCGICVEVCPIQVIEMTEADSIPSPTGEPAGRCINCGHCVAVCPHGALSLDTMSAEQCPPVREAWFPEPDHLEHFLRARRSIRSFREEGVDRSELAKLMEIARFAPTGGNRQGIHWLVAYETEKVEALAGMTIDFLRFEAKKNPSSAKSAELERVVRISESGYDYICRGAPHLIFAHAPESQGPTDSTIALTYLELAAFSFGLGPCWAGYVTYAARNWSAMQQFLELPEGHVVFGTMMIGRPKYKYHRLPVRDRARVTWIG